MSDLIPDHARQAVDSVGFLGALRYTPLRSITLWSITARSDDRSRDDDHSRSWNDALLDCLFETNVGVPGAFSTEIANGCETCLKCVSEVISGSCDAQTQRLVRDLIVPNSF